MSDEVSCRSIMEYDVAVSISNANALTKYQNAKTKIFEDWQSVFSRVEYNPNPNPADDKLAKDLVTQYENMTEPTITSTYNDACCYVDPSLLFSKSKNTCIGPVPTTAPTPAPTTSPTTAPATEPDAQEYTGLGSMLKDGYENAKVFVNDNPNTTIGIIIGVIILILCIVIISVVVSNHRKATRNNAANTFGKQKKI